MNIHNNINTHIINVNLTRTTHNRNKTRQATAATGQSLLQEIAAAQMFADAGNAGGGGSQGGVGGQSGASREVQILASMARACRHSRGCDFLQQALSANSCGLKICGAHMF